MYKEIGLNNVRASGWIERYLHTQLKGLTGDIGEVALPFSGKFWENVLIRPEDLPADAFLGGIIALDDAWVPFEQNGYWIDGLIRAGILIDDKEAIRNA